MFVKMPLFLSPVWISFICDSAEQTAVDGVLGMGSGTVLCVVTGHLIPNGLMKVVLLGSLDVANILLCGSPAGPATPWGVKPAAAEVSPSQLTGEGC